MRKTGPLAGRRLRADFRQHVVELELSDDERRREDLEADHPGGESLEQFSGEYPLVAARPDVLCDASSDFE